MTNEDDPRLVFIPLELAKIPPSGFCRCIKDNYWCVHPKKGLIFWDPKSLYPQCNSNKTISEMFKEKMYPWCEIQFIDCIFLPIKISDYRY